jgi:hypothetical protein
MVSLDEGESRGDLEVVIFHFYSLWFLCYFLLGWEVLSFFGHFFLCTLGGFFVFCFFFFLLSRYLTGVSFFSVGGLFVNPVGYGRVIFSFLLFFFFFSPGSAPGCSLLTYFLMPTLLHYTIRS